VLGEEMGRWRAERESLLTAELKERVGEVERGWELALGEAIEKAREAVGEWLESVGGWERGDE